MESLTNIRIEEWSSEKENNKLERSGGKIEVGDEYGSNFLAVYPIKLLSQPGKTFMVKLKIEKSTGFNTFIYHSADMTSWSRVSSVSFEDSTASFQATSGMASLFKH